MENSTFFSYLTTTKLVKNLNENKEIKGTSSPDCQNKNNGSIN